jgi:hypothetical protein
MNGAGKAHQFFGEQLCLILATEGRLDRFMKGRTAAEIIPLEQV